MSPIEQQIEGIVDEILEDYRHQRSIDKLDPFVHPDKDTVIGYVRSEHLMRIVMLRIANSLDFRPIHKIIQFFVHKI